MLKLRGKHVITGTELTTIEIQELLKDALSLKKERGSDPMPTPLAGKHLAMLFDKPSLRTRFSFAVAMHELGGQVVESVGSSRKQEEPEDVARVLGGYCHGIMVRTHEHSWLERLCKAATVPVINALSALHHPCQILADLLCLQERYQTLQDITVTYVGDGNNILHSWLLLAPALGIRLHYCCPRGHEPEAAILSKAQSRMGSGHIQVFATPAEAAVNADAIYTDVWTSMGFSAKDETDFAGFMVDETLMSHAHAGAVFMHCMPMERGKEVSATLPDQSCSIIFQQSENRLHVQKALLLALMG